MNKKKKKDSDSDSEFDENELKGQIKQKCKESYLKQKKLIIEENEE